MAQRVKGVEGMRLRRGNGEMGWDRGCGCKWQQGYKIAIEIDAVDVRLAFKVGPFGKMR